MNLKNHFPQNPLYERVAKIILQPENYGLILKLKNNNYKGASEIVTFFENMKEQMNKSPSFKEILKINPKESQFKFIY